MNAMLRRISIVVAIMFAVLMVNISVNALVRAPGLLEDPRNRRVRDAEYSQDRGAILVGNIPIAETQRVKNSRFRFKRYYPQGPLYAHVTGWYSYDFARSGLEQSYNAELSGTDSSQIFQRFVDLLSGKTPTGASVLTNIDPRAQQAASTALGDRVGAVMAMNYVTGEVRALVSKPTFDPNTLSNHNIGAEQAAWKKLNADPAKPLLNRASGEVFMPGSTFKLITAAAALESGLNPESLVDAPNSLSLPGTNHHITNAGSCGSGQVSIREGLVHSCNTAFANLGMTLGADALRTQAEKFGFDTSLAADFPTAKSRFPTHLDQAQTAMSAIGLFDVAASPLQMMLVAAAIANNGVIMEPHLASTVLAQDLSILTTNRPKELSRPISSKTASALKSMMREVVVNGTGQSANSSVATIYAKTGTAMQNTNRPNYAWMVGFSDDPKLVVVAIIADADSDRNDISGGRLAGPIVRKVIESVR